MSGLLHQLPVLLVVVPLGVAVLLAGSGHWLPRVVADAVATAVAALIAVGGGWLATATHGHRKVQWLGGWRPQAGESVGIALVADPASAALVVLAATLVCAGLVFSWRYLEGASATYHALMLAFLAGVTGFVLAGDLFDAFVWFELMGAAAYGLAGLRVEEARTVHAALGFGLVNSLGASFGLVGIALLYARTGELNLAAIGEQLHTRPADALVAFALGTLLVSALVKAAVVPFHFWTADTEAAAPTPVCAVLSGAMVVTGVYAVARWWWVCFDGVVSHDLVERLLVGAGALTAVVGAVMCAQQRHVKRVLAYSTISHVGVAMIGVGLLDTDGLLAAGAYLVGHACAKGPLFLASGVLLNRFGTVDELALHGRGRDMWLTASVFVLGGLGLLGLPALAVWWGKAELEDALTTAGLTPLVAVVVLAAALTGGTVLRVAARVFAGWGSDPREEGDVQEEPEERGGGRRQAALMLAPAWVLLAAGTVVAVVPPLHAAAGDAVAVFADTPGYATAVLQPDRPLGPVSGAAKSPWTTASLLWAALTLVLALVAAVMPLWASADRLRRPLATVGQRLHAVHRADVAEQCGWLVLGAGAVVVFLAH